jgi:aryl-alcohol dehydrogenase-like predicted oxidoreductase
MFINDRLLLGIVEVNQLAYSLLWRVIEYEILETCIQNEISVACYAPLAQGLLTGEFHSTHEVPLGREITRFYIMAERQAHGIPLDPVTWQKIQETANALRVSTAEPIIAEDSREGGVYGLTIL